MVSFTVCLRARRPENQIINQMASNLTDAISGELPPEQPEAGKTLRLLRADDWAESKAE